MERERRGGGGRGEPRHEPTERERGKKIEMKEGTEKKRPKRKSVTDVCREVSSGETYENTGNCWRSSTGGVSQ